MANSFLSANMSLVVPVVNVEIGPNWANDLNASLLIVDAHTHNPGSGVQVTPAGLNINTDLTFNSNNAIALRSSRFTPQGSPLAGGSDLGCLYEAGVDLYYNDGAGNQIRITQSGSVAGSAGTITGLPSGTASAAYQSASGTFQFQQATSTGANIDVASVIVRYPGSYPTPSGNAIVIEAPTSLASQYSLTLPALPAQTNVMTLTSAGIISSITYDQVGVNMSATGANAIANTRTRTTGSSVEGVGGVAISLSCGNFAFTSTSYTSATNLDITLTTNGRPVFLGLIPDASGLSSFFSANDNTVTCQFVNFTNTVVWQNTFGVNINIPVCLYIIDLSVSGTAGTYNYFFQVKTNAGGTCGLQFAKLIAFEL